MHNSPGRVVRDPVHGYVEVPAELDALVRTSAVQRLRNIAQNSRAVAGFPSMTGSRYEHALGTMHLAVRAWQHAWQNAFGHDGGGPSDTRDAFRRAVVRDLRAQEHLDHVTAEWIDGDRVEDTPLWQDFGRRTALVVGAVGLLHDVGHPPFSHVLEPFYARRVGEIFGAEAESDFADYCGGAAHGAQFHEWAGLQVLDLMPAEAFVAMPRALVRLVLADRSDHGWAHALHSVVDGQFDVDRLDYLVRDAINAGTEYGNIDADRLLQSLELHQLAEDDWRIGLGARAVSSFETMLVLRAQHYRWVVRHPAVVVANTALERGASLVHDLATATPTAVGRQNVPDLDYIRAAVGAADSVDPPCADDHDFLAWLRRERHWLGEMADQEVPAARTALAFLDVADTFALTPVPAWRNYQEFLARVDQNRDAAEQIAALAPEQSLPAYVQSPASRQSVQVLQSELPALLNAALDELIRPNAEEPGNHAAEMKLGLQVPSVPGCGDGFWFVSTSHFTALEDDFAGIWRDDEQALLSDVSPFPIALAALEIMRLRHMVFFVPLDARPGEVTADQRRAVGKAFFDAVSTWYVC
jgi:HD superfamily phosphohydrolase